MEHRRVKNRFAVWILAAILLIGTGCKVHRVPVQLTEDGELLCSVVRDMWLKSVQPPANILYMNAEKTQRVPPQFKGLIMSPLTTFDYIYVRTWNSGNEKTPVRRLTAYFVIRDVASGARLRGTVKDGLMKVEPLSPYHWELVNRAYNGA